MKKLAAALAAVLLSGSALADAPAPAQPEPAPAPVKDEGAARAPEKKAKDPKGARKAAPKPAATDPKEVPCEPVKPCPIE
jgi:hypothetical protein